MKRFHSTFSKIDSRPSFLGRGRRALAAAFTLVELLVVIATISILSALAYPSLMGLFSAGNVNTAVVGVSQTLNEARAYAMSHNTYVWVGFTESNTTPSALMMGVVAGTTGSSDDLGKPLNLMPVARVQHIPRFNLIEASAAQQANSAMPAPWSNGTELNTSGLSSFSVTSGGTKINFSNVLQFDPMGEASVASSGSLPHWIQFGLQPVGGNASNVVAIQVAGLSGGIQVFRP